jgi:hypothetical protein
MTQTAITISIVALIIFVVWQLMKFRVVKRPFPSEVFPSPLNIRLAMIFFTCMALAIFSSNIDITRNYKIAVRQTNPPSVFDDSSATKAKSFGEVEIEKSEYLVVSPNQSPNILIFLLSKEFLDSLSFLLISIMVTIGFWNFDFEDPFSIQISKPIYQIGYILIVLGLLSYCSNLIFKNYVSRKTNFEYVYDGSSFFDILKFLIGTVFLRLGQIFKTAEKIKAEQDLTV